MAFNEKIRQSFLYNLIIVLLLCTVLYLLFFASLRWITRHGEEVKIPNVTGIDMRTALNQLEGMGFEVYVDSTYEPKQKPYTVLKQIPDIASVVKTGRTVFITVNKTTPPATPMPNLVSLSFRSAEMILKNYKLILGDTSYKPDIAKGAVLAQLYNGQEIRPGQMIPEGSHISLVLGDGLGITQFNVPNVIGMTPDEGIADLTGNGLNPNVVWDADVTDSATALIYNQSPKPFNELGAPNRIKAGDIVDVWIKQNPTTEEMEQNKSAAGGVNKQDTTSEDVNKVPAP